MKKNPQSDSQIEDFQQTGLFKFILLTRMLLIEILKRQW